MGLPSLTHPLKSRKAGKLFSEAREKRQEKPVKGIYYTPRYTQDQYCLNIFRNHWDGYLEKHRDNVNSWQEAVVRRFIDCGNPHEGFTHVECPECGESYFVPHSCKTAICSSCVEKRRIEWADRLCGDVLLNINHRHLVWTIPTCLDHHFQNDAWLLGKFLETVCQTAKYLFFQNGKPGVVAVLETAGDRMNFNVHVHMLITECIVKNNHAVSRNGLEDALSEGIIAPLPRIPFRKINLLWRNKILALLKNTGRISRDETEQLKQRYSKGFVVFHVSRSLWENREEAKKLSAYLLKPAVNNRKIVEYDRQKAEIKIRFKYGLDEQRRNVYKHERISVDDFITRMVSHIMPWFMRKVRYYGIYSSRYRGMANPRKKEKRSWKGHRLSWRELIIRTFEVDPLACLACGAEMRVVKVYSAREVNIRDFTAYKYYIQGRWRRERRKEFQKPPNGMNRRKVA